MARLMYGEIKNERNSVGSTLAAVSKSKLL